MTLKKHFSLFSLLVLSAAFAVGCGQNKGPTTVPTAATASKATASVATAKAVATQPAATPTPASPAAPAVKPAAAAANASATANSKMVEAKVAPNAATKAAPSKAAASGKDAKPTQVATDAIAPPAAKPVTFKVKSGSATFLIDAPLENIKGRWSRTGGHLTVDPSDLTKTTGTFTVNVNTLKTFTFGDAGKDSKQTEHALNWLEVGPEVTAADRAKNGTARFVIEGIDGATPAALTAANSEVTVKAHGILTVHGIKKKTNVEVQLTFRGPANAPTGVHITNKTPMSVSLKFHDVKPRDLAGRFLMGALEKVGKKIDDRVQITVDLNAS